MSGLLAGSASWPIATTQASAGLSSVTARELETRLIVSPLAGEADELGIVLLVSFAGSRFRWGMGPHGPVFKGRAWPMSEHRRRSLERKRRTVGPTWTT